MKRIKCGAHAELLAMYGRISEHYFPPVEDIIRMRLPGAVLASEERFLGAQVVIQHQLKRHVGLLRKLVAPDASLYWDEHVDLAPRNPNSPHIIVDVVDGARCLRGGGTDVASTLCITEEASNVRLSVVSLPFARERIVDLNGEVYRLPSEVIGQHNLPLSRLDEFQLTPRKPVHELSRLRLAERCDKFEGKIRRRLDRLRSKVRGYSRPIGSIATMILAVVTTSCDVLIIKKQETIKRHDFLAPSQIVRDLGGVVTDLSGRQLTCQDKEAAGLIVASHMATFEMFAAHMWK